MVNLVLATFLGASALFIIARASWMKRNMHRHEVLQTFSGAAALLLVPANLVFAWSGALTRLNWLVIVVSILAVTTEFGLWFTWHRAPQAQLDEPTEPLHFPTHLRVLAVGTDLDALQEEAGPALSAIHDAGQEITTLVTTDPINRRLPFTQRTIHLDSQPQHGHAMTQRLAAHIREIDPHIVLAPSERRDFAGATALHWATRLAAEGATLLYYAPRNPESQEEPDPMSVAEQRKRDMAFRRPVEDDGRIRMPSFAAPWV